MASSDRPRRRLAAWLVGGLLAAVALVQFSVELLRDEAPRSEQSAVMPAAFNGVTLALEEDASSAGGCAVVTLRLGERRYPTDECIWRDTNAPAGDWLARYDGRWRVAANDAADGALVVLEVLRERSNIERVAWRTWLLGADGEVDTWRGELPAAQAQRQIALELFGAPPRGMSLWPPLAGLTLGLFVLLGAGLRQRPESWPSVGLVCIAAALASVVAWPIMLHIGLARTLPGALIAIFVSACFAALVGRRAQRMIVRGRAAGYAAGAAFAALLFMVFVNVYVTVGGFVAPVLRTPGEAASPMDLLVQDYIAPTVALTVNGLLPALLAGIGFSWWWRNRQARSSIDATVT